MVASSVSSSESAWAQICFCSVSLCAKIAWIQVPDLRSWSQAYEMCILPYLLLWTKEVSVKFERQFGKVVYLGGIETFSTQASGKLMAPSSAG